MADRFEKEAAVMHPEALAISTAWVPFVVEYARFRPVNEALKKTEGEFPNSAKSTFLPSRSAAVRSPLCLNSFNSSRPGTGIMVEIPLSKAAQKAVVARNTSTTTTQQLSDVVLYRNKAGEKQTSMLFIG